jgi:hypothetical protein
MNVKSAVEFEWFVSLPPTPAVRNSRLDSTLPCSRRGMPATERRYFAGRQKSCMYQSTVSSHNFVIACAVCLPQPDQFQMNFTSWPTCSKQSKFLLSETPPLTTHRATRTQKPSLIQPKLNRFLQNTYKQQARQTGTSPSQHRGEQAI